MFQWIEENFQFNEYFIKSYNKESLMKDIFSKLIFNIPKKLNNFHKDLPFLLGRSEYAKRFFYMIDLNMLFIWEI